VGNGILWSRDKFNLEAIDAGYGNKWWGELGM
jgi:hypothetical protein